MRRTLAVVVLLLVASACCPLTAATRRGRGQCGDGLPVRYLLDPHCNGGVCGWTCAPDRWREELAR